MSLVHYCGFCSRKHPNCQCPAIAYSLRDPITEQVTYLLRLEPKGFVPQHMKFEVLRTTEFTYEDMLQMEMKCASKGQPLETEYRQRFQKERNKAVHQERNQFGYVRVLFECGFCARKHSNLQCPAIAFTMRDHATGEITYFLRVEPKGFIPKYWKFEVLSTPTEFSFEDMLQIAKEYSGGREAELESLFRQRSQTEQKALESRNQFCSVRGPIDCGFCARRHAKLQCPAVAYTIRDPATEQTTYYLRKEPAGSVPEYIQYEVVRDPTKYSYDEMLQIADVCTREGQEAQVELIFKQISRMERNMAVEVRKSPAERMINCCFCTETHVENQCPVVAFTLKNPDAEDITFYLRGDPRGIVPALKKHVVLEPSSTLFTVEEMELKVEKYTSTGNAGLLPKMFLERSCKERARYQEREEQNKQADISTPRKSTKTSNRKATDILSTPPKSEVPKAKGKKGKKKSRKVKACSVVAEASLDDLRAPPELVRNPSEDGYTADDLNSDLESMPPTPYHNAQLPKLDSLASGEERILFQPGQALDGLDW